MHKRQITVAVVDDDPNILDSVRELLNAKGFIAEPFESAEGFLCEWCHPSGRLSSTGHSACWRVWN